MAWIKILKDYSPSEGWQVGDIVELLADHVKLVEQGLVELVEGPEAPAPTAEPVTEEPVVEPAPVEPVTPEPVVEAPVVAPVIEETPVVETAPVSEEAVSAAVEGSDN